MATPKLKGEDDDDEQQTDTDPADEEVEENEQTDAEDTGDDDEVETDEVELPEDEEDDGEYENGSLLSGSTLGVSNKVLLGVGIAAVILVLLLRSSEANSSTRDYSGGDEQVEEEIEEGTEGELEERVTDAGGSNVKFDQRAQDDAVESIFG